MRSLLITTVARKLPVIGFLVGVVSFGTAQEVVFQNFDGFLSIGTQSHRTAGISLTDLDNDGDLDALVANGRHWAEQNYIFYNDGKGSFKQGQPIGRFLDASYEIKAADVNQDGYIDIFVANDNIPNALYFGGKNQEYIWQGTFGAIAPTRGITLVDLDNDSDLDIVLANRNAPNEICWNDGSGNFDTCTSFGGDKDPTIQVAIADLDKDGWLDIVTAERKSTNHIYFNQGNRNFSDPISFGSADDDTRAVVVHDMDQDGFTDIVVGNLGTQNEIYFGNAATNFTRTYKFREARMTASVAVTDFNKDGWPDLVMGNAEEVNYVQLGSESGTFTEIALNKDLKEDTYKVTTGDLNGDGLPDIIEANSGDWNLIYRTRIRE